MDEINALDILIKLEFPTLPEFGKLILSDVDAEPTRLPSLIFRFNYDRSFSRFGLGAISALFLPKLSFLYETSTEKKTDCDISSLWSTLVQKFPPAGSNNGNATNVPQWVVNSRDAIQNGNATLCKSGVGGTYFVSRKDEDGDEKMISVFKPTDEEPGAPNNPKKHTNFAPMLPWGAGANREVAAYKIGAFAGVPETHFFEATNEKGIVKRGSLQQFVQNDGDCSEFGASKFSIDSVHRLGILDIMILNLDRNEENLLVKKTDNDWTLIPIDHTYCFPTRVNSYFNWQYWPQAKKPFSDANLTLISSIDVMTNAQILKDTGIDDESVRNVTASTLLLQKASQRGFNLFQIASFVSGDKNDLVDILSQAREKESEYYRNSLSPTSTYLQKVTLFRNMSEKLIEDFLCKKCNVVY